MERRRRPPCRRAPRTALLLPASERTTPPRRGLIAAVRSPAPPRQPGQRRPRRGQNVNAQRAPGPVGEQVASERAAGSWCSPRDRTNSTTEDAARTPTATKPIFARKEALSRSVSNVGHIPPPWATTRESASHFMRV